MDQPCAKKDIHKLMDRELYKAAVNGNISYITEALSSDIETGKCEYLVNQTTSQQNNILHIAAQHGHVDFSEMVARNFPNFICQRNSSGDTPLHIAARNGNKGIVEFLVCVYKDFAMSTTSESENELSRVEDENRQQPWKMKNLEGDTPLHLAISHGKVLVARFLMEIGPEVASFVNNAKESPLHLAIKYSVEGDRALAVKSIQILNSRQVSLTYKGCSLCDDSMSLIQLLLQRNCLAACWCDADDLTPLLRAAMKAHVPAIKAIIQECPESVELYSRTGQTILHLYRSQNLEDAKELLQITEIRALKDQQDQFGNTPAHEAVRNRDVYMLQALSDCSANHVIKNKDGVSAAALMHQLQSDFLSPAILEINDAEYNIVGRPRGNIPAELYSAAIKGEVDFMHKIASKAERESLLSSRTLSGENIVHLVCQRNNDDEPGIKPKMVPFIEAALKSLPILICQVDSKGNTPFHIIICRHEIDGAFLSLCESYYQTAQQEASRHNEELYCAPWNVKNMDGNTPIFVALQSGYVANAHVLIEFNSEVALEVNNENETILHVLSGSADNSITDDNIDFLIKANPSAVIALDSHSLTPLLKAVSDGSIRLAERLIHHYPMSVLQCDSNGGTVLHRMTQVCPENIDSIRNLLVSLRRLWNVKDKDGNTPLHVAIEKGNFGMAKLLMEQPRPTFSLRNRDGIMTGELLGSADNIPQKFQRFLWKRVDVAAKIFGIRSMRGIPTTEIKNYINTLSVTAALLTTITFTAAFTVPGGFNSQDGTPLNARKAAFLVFMISDITALCLSMTVLFCLLWVIIGTREERVVLVDLSLGLLQASFYATLLTFMTGVYMTITPTESWLAILTCIACSLLILFLHKRFIMSLVPCYQVLYSKYLLACNSVRELLRHSMYKTHVIS